MSGRVLLGLLLIVVGAGYLLDTLGVIADFPAALRVWWPLIIVVLGLNWLAKNVRHPWWPLLVTVIGVLLLLSRLLPDFARYFWPIAGAAALVAVGVRLLLPRGRPAATRRGAAAARKESGEASVRYAVTFGALEARNTAAAFRGGDLDVGFGALTLDLRDATLAPEGAVLNVRALFGGVEILLPCDWAIAVHGHTTLGAVENSTANATSGAPMLTINAAVTMAAIELKN
ncbi:MAG TPA: LiaF-related protein [Armatimonadota bacterium]|nr:LiaF-related protein [Armatimonadota bacterium]HOS42460.1 LiaF-related protein [Armatimonadota bacterium]